LVRGLGGGSECKERACEEYGALGKAHGVQWGGKLRMWYEVRKQASES
jgi:hypothetical protein